MRNGQEMLQTLSKLTVLREAVAASPPCLPAFLTRLPGRNEDTLTGTRDPRFGAATIWSRHSCSYKETSLPSAREEKFTEGQ